MTTLVTGATGLVGNNVVRRLLEEGQNVRVLVRRNADPRPLADLDGVEIVHGDVRDPQAVDRAVQGVDRVIHAAALVHIGWTGLENLPRKPVVVLSRTSNTALIANLIFGPARYVFPLHQRTTDRWCS